MEERKRYQRGVLPADWLEYVRDAEMELKRSPQTKRRMPRVSRMNSRRQRIAESQTRNPIRAIYTTESKYNATPTKPEDWRGTRNPGKEQESQYRAGKATVQPPTGYSKVTPRMRRGSYRRTTTTPGLDELMQEYE